MRPRHLIEPIQKELGSATAINMEDMQDTAREKQLGACILFEKLFAQMRARDVEPELLLRVGLGNISGKNERTTASRDILF